MCACLTLFGGPAFFAPFVVCACLTLFGGQRFVWVCWYELEDDRDSSADFAYWSRWALMGVYTVGQALLLLLFLAYHYDGSPYASGGWVVFILYQAFLLALPVLAQQDFTGRQVFREMQRDQPVSQTKCYFTPELSAMQTVLVLLVLAASASLSVVGFVDADIKLD